MGYRACLGVLALARKYGRERLEAACAHAVRIGALRRKSVASILQAGLDQQPSMITDGPRPPGRQTEWPLPLHENVRGPKYYH